MNPASSATSVAPASFHPASGLDYIPREQLRGLQSERLRHVVRQVFEGVPLYRQRMQKQGVTPEDILSVDDVGKLPLTTKADLRHAYPVGMFAVPVQRLVRLHQVAAASAAPVVVAYTQRDVEIEAQNLIRSLAACGVRRGDVVLSDFSHGAFAERAGLHRAVEALGATVIPDGGGDTGRQLMILEDFGVSATCCTPHRFLHLLDRAQKMGVSLRDLPLRVGLFITERWGEGIRKRIEDAAGIRAYEIYGLPEASGVAVGTECHQRNGSHVFEDQFLPEIIDPASGQPLPDGQEGELVITTLGAEATPLIRYRTHDRTTILAESCECGRTMRRIGRVAGSDDSLFVIQGVDVLPSQVEAAILAVESTLHDYRILLSQEAGVDRMAVEVEISAQVLGDRVGPLESLQSDLQHEIERAVGIAAAVHLVEPHTIARKYGDGGRVIDKRSS